MKRADVMLVATFVALPLIGTPVMLAICVDFLSKSLRKSNSPMSDLITLLGFLLAYHLALVLVLLAWSAESALLWCSVAWPMTYGFCRFALTPTP